MKEHKHPALNMHGNRAHAFHQMPTVWRRHLADLPFAPDRFDSTREERSGKIHSSIRLLEFDMDSCLAIGESTRMGAQACTVGDLVEKNSVAHNPHSPEWMHESECVGAYAALG